jgi:ABC-type nickel/cobalt efflux system permease component RcnA
MQTLARQHMAQPRHALATGGPALANFVVASGPDAYGRRPGHAHYGHNHGDDDHHGHAHVVMPTQTGGGWREQLGVVLAVGLRPCSGALIVLAFALSQGLLAAGIVAVVLMGLGTALTTGALAALAVGAKGVARRLAGADNPATAAILWWVELLAAIAVLVFGAVLLFASL